MKSIYSYRAVNLLFFLVLSLQALNLLFTWLPQYVRLNLNQALFVFLPAYLYLRLTRQPAAERVRWHWPGWKVGLLAGLIGLGLYPVSAATAGILIQVLGYSNLPVQPDVIPTTLLMGVLAILAYAVMAPLCEEFLFRGVIQPVYEQRSGRTAVLFTGLLFIVFHLSLLQGLSIVLLALVLGFIFHRTRSLPASILAHFGANLPAALLLTEGLFPWRVQPFLFSPLGILGGVGLSFLSLAGLIFLTARRADEPERTTRLTPSPLWAAAWPLLAAGILYLGFVGMEVLTARNPEQAAPPLILSPVRVEGQHTWQFSIYNVIDEAVGEGECLLEAGGDEVELTCLSETRPYEVQIGRSYYASSGGTRRDQTRWRQADGQIVSGSTLIHIPSQEYDFALTWTMGPSALDIQIQEGGTETATSLPLEVTPLQSGEKLLVVTNFTWPWQIQGIPLRQGEVGRVVYFNAHTWRQATQDMGPQAETLRISVSGLEDAATPAGYIQAWKVDLGGQQTAWYALDSPHLVVKFFNRSETLYQK
jgi:uncharacterized protein